MKRVLCTIAVLGVINILTACLAQEVVFEDAPPNPAPSAFVPSTAPPAMVFPTLPSSVDVWSASPQPYIPPPNGAPAFFVSGSPFGDSDNFGMLHDPSVRKDLEILDDQMKQITDLQREHGKQMGAWMKKQQDNGGFNTAEGRQEYVREMQKMQSKQQESIREVLLPHQRERFKQVSHQMKMQMMGMANSLHHGSLSETLEISNSQKTRLREIEKEFRKELAEKTKEITEAAEQRMLDELSTEQQEQLQELTGEKFKHDPADWGDPMPLGSPIEPTVNEPSGKR